MKTKGIFITLEGIDGCGKSTQARLLVDTLHSADRPTLLTREPGGTTLGDHLRLFLLDPASHICPEAELFLYLADRAQHVQEVILPALNAGQIVVSERFADSTVAYQCAGRGLSRSKIQSLNRIATGGLLPHLTLLLDISPAAARRRKENHPLPADRFEQLSPAFYRRLAAEYRTLATNNPKRIKIVRATGSESQVNRRILEAVKTAFPRLLPAAASAPRRKKS